MSTNLQPPKLLPKAGVFATTNLVTDPRCDEPIVWPPFQYTLAAGLFNKSATFHSDDPNYQYLHSLSLHIFRRYIDSAFCTWRLAGGSTPTPPKVQRAGSRATGTTFEKYNGTTTNAAGGGREYEVVEGFGWSHGVLIWMVDLFRQGLKTPDCGLSRRQM